MSSGTEDFHADWERQRVALSALLDGELETGQRARLEGHLATCERCRAEYAALGRTRALLRALPQPALPRSFALPVDADPPVRSITETRTRRAHAGAFSRTAQRVGSLVAAAGLILLIGSWLTSFSGLGSGARNAASKYAGGASSAQNGQSVTTASAPAHTPPDFAASTRAPEVGASATSATHVTAASPTPATTSGPSNDSATSVPVLPLTGAGLTLGGVALVIAGRATKARQERGR